MNLRFGAHFRPEFDLYGDIRKLRKARVQEMLGRPPGAVGDYENVLHGWF